MRTFHQLVSGYVISPGLLERLALKRARGVIDGIDDGMLMLLAARRQVVRTVAVLKPRVGVSVRDPVRERHIHERALGLAARLHLPAATAKQMLDVAIADACHQQGLSIDLGQSAPTGIPPTMAFTMSTSFSRSPGTPRLLRLLPPPRRMAPLLRVVPARWQRRLLEAAMARVLNAPLREGALDFMRGRRLAIEVSDLRLRWVLELREQGLCVSDDEPEATVRGSATDLLLLAGRLEDADTLFFQRRLVLTGDTELGLTARNMLERLPWETIPLGLRIALNRGARFARVARAAHRRETA
jgi:predicted lipid carrier protein YhbT/chorismate mutase